MRQGYKRTNFDPALLVRIELRYLGPFDIESGHQAFLVKEEDVDVIPGRGVCQRSGGAFVDDTNVGPAPISQPLLLRR